MEHIHRTFVLFVFLSVCYSFRPPLRHGFTRSRMFSTEQLVSTNVNSEPALEITKKPWEVLKNGLMIGWSEALKGNQSLLLDYVSPNAKWENPLFSSSVEMKDGFQKFSEYFLEPSLIVFDSNLNGQNAVSIDYQLSFSYPLPWTPRVIIPGKAIITASPDFSKVLSVQETWNVSWLDIFSKQIPPRFWDVWHLFNTPSPEYPEIKTIQSDGKVTFFEMPRTVAIEVIWSGLSKFPGPPLFTLPGFSLFGDLKTSQPNPDKIFPVIPVEVLSSRYTSLSTGEEMKRSSWILHVPTLLQPQIFEKALKSELISFKQNDDKDKEEDDDFVEERDYIVGLENLNVMASVKGGTLRLNFNETITEEMLTTEQKYYRYKIIPKRTIAAIDIYGEATLEKISEALKEIKNTISNQRDGSKKYKLAQKSSTMTEDDMKEIKSNQLGLHLYNCKACFNKNAELAMAIYEQQFSLRQTRVFLEVEDLSQ